MCLLLTEQGHFNTLTCSGSNVLVRKLITFLWPEKYFSLESIDDLNCPYCGKTQRCIVLLMLQLIPEEEYIIDNNPL